MRQARVVVAITLMLLAGAALPACKEPVPPSSQTPPESVAAPAAGVGAGAASASVAAEPIPSPSPSATLPASALALGADPATPPEVWAFLVRYENCVELQSEEPYDEARKKEVAEGIAATCTGNEEALLALRKKYAADPIAMKLLTNLYGRE